MSCPTNPIIVVTGANSGVGFGICHRLFFNFIQPNPPDALPQHFSPQLTSVDETVEKKPLRVQSLTLILACRSAQRAEKARTKLLTLFDEEVKKIKRSVGYDGYAEILRKKVVVEVESLDLAVMGSVFKCARSISKKYPYVSHLILNAGVGGFKDVYFPLVFEHLFNEPTTIATTPRYYRQYVGEMSSDGLGWKWQSNLFGHYAFYRALQSQLSASPEPARIIWSSSHEATPDYLDLDDFQATKTEHSYESVKYQIDILGNLLDRRAVLQAQSTSSDHSIVDNSNNMNSQIRHFVTQPGVCSTNVAASIVNPLTEFIKIVFFYFARLLGSTHHTIVPFVAAISTVHVALAPIYLFTHNDIPQPHSNGHAPLTKSSDSKKPSKYNGSEHLKSKDYLPLTPHKFGAQSDRLGRGWVGVMEVPEGEEHMDHAEELLKRCEGLYLEFWEREKGKED